MELVIWTNMGRSLVFENVTNFGFTTQGIEFDYIGASTNKKRHANFNNTSMAGYATTDKTKAGAK